ncbi:MAG: hypothetical protein DRP50_07115, partial [Thermotoga sp.]
MRGITRYKKEPPGFMYNIPNKQEVFLMKIIHLKRAKMEVTPFGGLLLVHDFIRNIGLEAFVK